MDYNTIGSDQEKATGPSTEKNASSEEIAKDNSGPNTATMTKNSSICNASLLRIGSWEIVPLNEGDLFAVFSYAKRRFGWEILDRAEPLMKKIEIQWSHVLAIRATLEENQPGILEMELDHPPVFYKTRPQPRSLADWRMTSDFTNNQASVHRIHYLQFPPGALARHYAKLILCTRFSTLRFPSLDSPYFDTTTSNNPVYQDAESNEIVAESSSRLNQMSIPDEQTNNSGVKGSRKKRHKNRRTRKR